MVVYGCCYSAGFILSGWCSNGWSDLWFWFVLIGGWPSSKPHKTKDMYGNLKNGLQETENIITAMIADIILKPKWK